MSQARCEAESAKSLNIAYCYRQGRALVFNYALLGAFLTQSEDFAPNHFVSSYQQAIDQELEMNKTRRYPISAID